MFVTFVHMYSLSLSLSLSLTHSLTHSHTSYLFTFIFSYFAVRFAVTKGLIPVPTMFFIFIKSHLTVLSLISPLLDRLPSTLLMYYLSLPLLTSSRYNYISATKWCLCLLVTLNLCSFVKTTNSSVL